MKTLRTLARGCVAVLFVPLVYLAWFAAAAREARMKRRLGRHYEGPLDD